VLIIPRLKQHGSSDFDVFFGTTSGVEWIHLDKLCSTY
jgi:hypothetical protein